MEISHDFLTDTVSETDNLRTINDEEVTFCDGVGGSRMC